MRAAWLRLLGAVLLTAFSFEAGARLANARGWLAAEPSGAGAYWWGDHPTLGVWRHPNASLDYDSPCLRAHYRTNSVGARDVEREREAARPRVIVLGDSFLEGWGLPVEARLSNRLERATGIPHLNFAMAHFGPYQSLLAYEELARGYRHDAVLVSVLPANDFLDLDLDLARRLPGYEYVYRPYLMGRAPHYEEVHVRENAARRWLRERSHAFNAILAALARIRERRMAADYDRLRGGSAEDASWFYDYREEDVARLESILRRLAGAAEGRPVAVLLIPQLYDLRRYGRSGPAPLTQRLRALERDTTIRIVDLVPAMSGRGGSLGRHFFPCDNHWNAFGNAVAAEITLDELRTVFYAPLESSP
jgi:hypothetical protein